MKKFLCLILAGILMFQTICIAADSTKMGAASVVVSRLRKFEEFSETIDNVLLNTDGKITRRDALTMVMNLFAAPHGLPNMTQQDKFVDVGNGTHDCALVKYAASFGFLNGKSIDGELYADLDSYITYYEALILISRLFKNESIWYEFARENGIVGEEFNLEKQHEEIPADVFMNCFYKALYVPYSKDTYGGRITDYYIHDLIRLVDEGELDNSKNAVEALEGLCIADTALFENETEIRRDDALALLVRSVGMMVSVGYGSCYGGSIQPEKYVEFSDLSETDVFKEWYLKGKYTKQDTLAFASFVPDFVYGTHANEDGTVTFDTDRAITTKEAVAFMVRLLNCPEVDKKNLDATYAHAYEVGLLKDTDAFAENPDAPLSPEEYFIILHRFLYQPKYIYYGSEFVHFATGDGEDWILTDKEGTEKYIDYLLRVVPQLLEAGALQSGSHFVTYE